MSNVDYKKKYFKLKGLVAKSLGAIERISDLEQAGGSGDAAVESAASNLDNVQGDLRAKLEGFVGSLKEANDKAAQSFQDEMGAKAGQILEGLVGVADNLINTVDTLSDATGREITEYTTTLAQSAKETLDKVNENINELRSEVSISNMTGGDDCPMGDKGGCGGDHDEDGTNNERDHDELIGGSNELQFYEN